MDLEAGTMQNNLHRIGEPCQISAPTTMHEPPHRVEVQDSQLLNRPEPENRKKLIDKTRERKAKRLKNRLSIEKKRKIMKLQNKRLNV